MGTSGAQSKVNWNSWSDFAAMGGYSLFVWCSFGLTAAVVVAEVWAIRMRHRALMRSLEAVEHDEGGAGR